jgi:hypothetical protein
MDGSRVKIFDDLILADSRRSGAVHPNRSHKGGLERDGSPVAF